MTAKTFIQLMFLLLVLTTVLLVATPAEKQVVPLKEVPAGATGTGDIQTQAADGSMLLESVSRHLLSAVQ